MWKPPNYTHKLQKLLLCSKHVNSIIVLLQTSNVWSPGKLSIRYNAQKIKIRYIFYTQIFNFQRVRRLFSLSCADHGFSFLCRKCESPCVRPLNYSIHSCLDLCQCSCQVWVYYPESRQDFIQQSDWWIAVLALTQFISYVQFIINCIILHRNISE